MLRTYTRILPMLAIAGAAGLLFVGRGWAAEVWVTNMKSASVQVIDNVCFTPNSGHKWLCRWMSAFDP